jgi:hypothetical protein
MITQFDRISCKVLRADITAALATVAQKHGIDIKPGSGRFSPTSFTIKIEAAVRNDNGEAQSKDRVAYINNAMTLGLPKIGTRFTSYTGGEFEITGLRTQARKRPVVARKLSDGTSWVFTIEQIRNYC